jgi:hypothetical protein
MKLGEIRNYVKQHGHSSLIDVANHFDISKEAAKLALEYWIKKGKIKPAGNSCQTTCKSGCSSGGSSCATGQSSENYQWVADKQEIRIHWF